MFMRSTPFWLTSLEDETECATASREKKGPPDSEPAQKLDESSELGDKAPEGERKSHSFADGAGATPHEADGGLDPVSALAAELDETKEKLAETHDRMLRIAADFENARKRWDRERDDVRRYSIAEFARELLPVIDAFDNAMAAIENAEFKADTEETRGLSAIIEGVQLVQKAFHESIKKHGIERLPGKGEPFNPEFHNAIARDVDQAIERDLVAEEFVSGYRIGDRVLRTAMVKVLTRD